MYDIGPMCERNRQKPVPLDDAAELGSRKARNAARCRISCRLHGSFDDDGVLSRNVLVVSVKTRYAPLAGDIRALILAGTRANDRSHDDHKDRSVGRWGDGHFTLDPVPSNILL